MTYSGNFSVIATGLEEPTGITFGTSPSSLNTLYVCNSGGGNQGFPGDIVAIANATGANPTASTFVAARTEGLSYPSALFFGPSGNLIVVDLGGSAPTSVGKVLAFSPSGHALTPLVAAMPKQFPSDAAFNSSGVLLTTNFGENYPPNLIGSIGEYSGGKFLGNFISSKQFAITGPGTSGFSPSALTLTAGVRAPVVNPGTSYTINEGSSLTLHATGEDPQGYSLTYSWDVNGDGVFGDATGANPTLNWSQLEALGINRSGTWQVDVMASDGHGEVVTSGTVTLTVNYVAPDLTIRGPSTFTVGQTYTLQLQVDPSATGDPVTWTIFWGDGTTSQVAGNVTTVKHVFTAHEDFTITATAANDEGTYNANDLKVS